MEPEGHSTAALFMRTHYKFCLILLRCISDALFGNDRQTHGIDGTVPTSESLTKKQISKYELTILYLKYIFGILHKYDLFLIEIKCI